MERWFSSIFLETAFFLSMRFSLNTGLAFCALVDSIQPGLLDFGSLSAGDPEKNLTLGTETRLIQACLSSAFDVASKSLKIAPLLEYLFSYR